MKQELGELVMKNIVFILQFLGIVAAIFIIAYIAEKILNKRSGVQERILSTRKIAMIGMFSAIATVLHIMDFPLPFAPDFYKLDFSELPALIGTFAFGPIAGVMIEFCKIVLKLVFKSTSTAFIGDLANFLIGCSFLLPASIIYACRKNRKSAVIGCIVGTAMMTVFGSLMNAVYLLPKFAELYGIPVENIIQMGNVINNSITDVTTFVFFAVVPLNLIKGSLVSVITLLIYKKLSPILKEGRKRAN